MLMLVKSAKDGGVMNAVSAYVTSNGCYRIEEKVPYTINWRMQ